MAALDILTYSARNRHPPDSATPTGRANRKPGGGQAGVVSRRFDIAGARSNPVRL